MKLSITTSTLSYTHHQKQRPLTTQEQEIIKLCFFTKEIENTDKTHTLDSIQTKEFVGRYAAELNNLPNMMHQKQLLIEETKNQIEDASSKLIEAKVCS